MVKLIIHDFISNTLDLLVVVSKPKIVRKHYCYDTNGILIPRDSRTGPRQKADTRAGGPGGQGGPPRRIGVGALAVGVPRKPRCQGMVVVSQVIVSGVDGCSHCCRCRRPRPHSCLRCCPESFQLLALQVGRDLNLAIDKSFHGRQQQADSGGGESLAAAAEGSMSRERWKILECPVIKSFSNVFLALVPEMEHVFY